MEDEIKSPHKIRYPEMKAPDRIRKWLKKKGFTQGMLGDALGVTRLTVYRWMRGETRPSDVQRWAIWYITGQYVKLKDWLSQPEKDEVERYRANIHRLRVARPVPELTTFEKMAGKLGREDGLERSARENDR